VRIPGSGRLALALAAALAALVSARPAGAALPAAEGERISAQRLRFEQKCFYEIDQWKGKGEEKFLERVENQIPIYRVANANKQELDELQELLGECYRKRVEHYAAAKDKPKQSDFFGKILRIESSYGKLEKLKAEAELFVLEENLLKAETAFTAKDFNAARTAYRDLVGIQKVREKAVGRLVEIEMLEGGHQGAVENTDLETKDRVFGEILGKIEKSLGPAIYADQRSKNSDISGMEKMRDDIKNTTQKLSIRPFDTSAAVANVVGGKTAADLASATFLFEPVSKDSGKRFPEEGKSGGAPKDKSTGKFKEQFLFFRGTYNVTVFVGGRPVASSCQFTVGDAPMTYEFPNSIPAGMVYVGKWQDGGGGFFIDVTEVTRAQVQAVAGEDEKLRQVLKDTNEGDDSAAWFEEEAALAYEKATGKSIPSKEEWIQAAFGPYPQSQRPYPWGTEAPTEDRAFVAAAADEPRPCGGRAKGKSPFQVEDMAGNMSEWVRIEGRLWLMGGNYVTSLESLARPLTGNPMRDPQPGKVAYDDMTDGLNASDKTRLNDYKIDSTQAYVTGLRMVVKVNK